MKQKTLGLVILVLCFNARFAQADSESQNMVSSDNAVRETAFQQMGSLSDADRKSMVAGLVKLLNDSDIDRRERALEAIGKIGPSATAAIPALRKALNDDLPYIRKLAAEALATMGSAALPVYLEELKNENGELRAIAAASIGKLNPAECKSAIPALIRALSDTDSAVRQRSETALERMGPDAVPPLLANLDAAGGETKLAMIRLLGSVDSTDPAALQKLIGYLNNDNKQTELTAIRALDRKSSAAVPALIEALKSDDVSVRIGVCEVLADLGRKGTKAVPALVTALKDPQADVRAQSAVALGKMGSEAALQAVPALEEAKKDSDPQVAMKAADALTNLIATIQKTKGPSLFANQNNAEVPAVVSKTPATAKIHAPMKPKAKPHPALAKVHAAKSRMTPATLMKQLESADEAKRAAAAQSLVQLGAKAVPALIQGMDNANPIVRASAGLILGDITPPATTAVPALSKTLQDSVFEVRQNASAALIKIDKAAAVSALMDAARSTDVAVSTQAIASVGQLGADAKDAVPALAEITKSTNTDVSAQAADTLDKIGTPEARKAIDLYKKQLTTKAVAAAMKDLRKDPNTVNRPAVDALIRIGAPAVPQVMLDLKDNHPVVRESAAEALNGIGKDAGAATAALSEALDDSDATVRHESASALEKIGTPAATKPLGMYRIKEKFRDGMHLLHLN